MIWHLSANARVLIGFAIVAGTLLAHWWRGDWIFCYGLDSEGFAAFSADEEEEESRGWV